MQTSGRFVAPFAIVGGVFLSWLPVGLPLASGTAPVGCVLTFRHGGTVDADDCKDMGEAMAYRRFGGWVVVRKSVLTSVANETGTTRFNPPWTPEEGRAQAQVLPREGGVPIAPAAPEAPAAPPPQPPTVVYVPVPTPEPAPPVYQVAAPAYGYAVPIVACRTCVRHHPGGVKPPFVRVVPTNPSDIGPMAIQKSFPSISPLR